MKLLKEPLLHFLLLGAALFVIYAAFNRNRPSAPDQIVITPGRIENLAATFAKVWQRPPSEQELKAQIDMYVKEEILSREAVKLGLDKNDTVIRRRLQQKMEFLSEDFAAREPTETELADYLAKHPDKFAEDPHFSFRQVFLNPEKRGDQLAEDAARLLANLQKQGPNSDTTLLGDSTLLPQELNDESQHGVDSQFGSEFANALADIKPGEWSGPIQSAYGLHLVFVSQKTEGRVPALSEVSEQVKREVMNERRQATNRMFLEELLKRYQVVIEWPKSEPSTNSLTASRTP